ncbi:MAG: SPL family radical SAM protein [Hyphomicrobiales bacterium]
MTVTALYVDTREANAPEAVAMSLRLRLPMRTVASADEVYAAAAGADDPVHRGKQILYLTRNKGAFLKPCPGTGHYTCCGYQILHIGSFCSMDCSYCILQAYFHPPVLQYFLNHADMIQELDRAFSQPQVQRIGTGEFTDSLIWEPWTDLSQKLIGRFDRQDRAVLELKTKTTHVDALRGLSHNRKTIMAWSLNTERMIRSEERGTASLEARLRAAAECAEAGYPLAFHFDPILVYEDCEADYRNVVQRLFAAVRPEQIVWISLGTFRFMPGLKSIIQKRFPRSNIIYGEFITGLDGKMRYFKPVRMKLYRGITAAIHARAPELCVYLCMEDDEVWQDALGFRPADRGGLPRMLDEAAVRHCGVTGLLT